MINIVIFWNAVVEVEEGTESTFRSVTAILELASLVLELVELFLLADWEGLIAGWATGCFYAGVIEDGTTVVGHCGLMEVLQFLRRWY